MFLTACGVAMRSATPQAATMPSHMKTGYPASMLLCLLALCAPMGCKSAAQKPKPHPTLPPGQTSEVSTDSPDKTGGCDSRLHDISGLFLLYDAMNHHLPDSLDDLSKMPGADDVGDFTCPVSHQKYLYVPKGIPSPSGAGRIILFDATPAHGGMRLAIEITQTKGSGALVTKVIALPDAFFQGK